MPQYIALLDFGSNAVRLVHARLSRSGVRILELSRVRARLASGARGSLSSESIEQSLRAAARFLKRVQSFDPRVLAVATASVRDAPNARALVDRLPALGVSELRILSGIEEAQLGAEAALRAWPLRTGAIIDLGGGSLQWSTIRAGRAKHQVSLPLGAARLTREFIRHDPPSERDLDRLREHVCVQLAAGLPGKRARGHLLALGGTARALVRRRFRRGLGSGRAKKRHAATLTLTELVTVRVRLQNMSFDERKHLRGMRPERTDILVAGALILEQVMAQSGYEELTVCNASVRDGVLWREARALMGDVRGKV